MPISTVKLLKTMTLDELTLLAEELNFKLRATTKEKVVQGLAKAIERRKISDTILLRKIDRIKHPPKEKRIKETIQKVPTQIKRILNILNKLAEIPKTISRETENILQNNVKTALNAKGYGKILREKSDTKPVMAFTKKYTPDFSISDKEIGNIALELKVLRDKNDLSRAFHQVNVYRREYRHVILFFYDAGQREKPDTPVITDDGTLKQEKKNLVKRNIYIGIKWHRDIEETMLKTVQANKKVKHQRRSQRIKMTAK